MRMTARCMIGWLFSFLSYFAFTQTVTANPIYIPAYCFEDLSEFLQRTLPMRGISDRRSLRQSERAALTAALADFSQGQAQTTYTELSRSDIAETYRFEILICDHPTLQEQGNCQFYRYEMSKKFSHGYLLRSQTELFHIGPGQTVMHCP